MRTRPVAVQERIAREMARLGMRMGVFVAHTIHWTEPNLASGRDEWRDEFLAEIRAAVDVARRVDAKWMTVVPGHVDLRLDAGYQTANVVESLRRAADILAPHDLVMVLEPLNPRDHPGLFLKGMPQAFGNLPRRRQPGLQDPRRPLSPADYGGESHSQHRRRWDEIAYFQIGDNPGRREPTTGEINYANVFQHIHEKGFAGHSRDGTRQFDAGGGRRTGRNRRLPIGRPVMRGPRTTRFAFGLACVLSAACGAGETTIDRAEPPADPEASSSDWAPVIGVVVERLQLAPGERVFAAALPGLFDETPRGTRAGGGGRRGRLSGHDWS